jgi:uncharacterized LabA/DUF88 family protein
MGEAKWGAAQFLSTVLFLTKSWRMTLAGFVSILASLVIRLQVLQRDSGPITIYYHCMPYMSNPPDEVEKRRFASMDSFVFNLKKLPRLQVRQGKLQRIGNQFHQKRVDIWMAVDLVRMSSSRQIEKSVLVTGDSDLVPAIEVARDCGVVVSLYYSPNSRHDELLQACDERYEITKSLIDIVRLPITEPRVIW